MRKRIEEYLQQGIGGKFYYRMVDTVLSRDKNWARWKAEGCPPIERPAVSVTEYLGARERATKIYANKRLRSSPAGALDLRFLLDDDSLKQLKEPVRYVLLRHSTGAYQLTCVKVFYTRFRISRQEHCKR